MEKAVGSDKKENSVIAQIRPVAQTVGRVTGKIFLWIYRLRRFLMAIPVLYFAFRFANENLVLLPEQVGINLLSTGEFAQMISRNAAVYGPLGLTVACLALMFFTRRTLYPWLISWFTLVLPWLIRLLNQYM